MRKIIYILCLFNLAFSAAFASTERFNTLSNIQIEQQSYRGVTLKLYTSNAYNQQIIPKRINKYTYVITLPNTKSSINLNSEFFQTNTNIKVKTIHSGNEIAYTKIIVTMPVTIPLSLNFAISNSGTANKKRVYQVRANSISMQSTVQKPTYQSDKPLKKTKKNVKPKEDFQIRNSAPAKITSTSINIHPEASVPQQNQQVYKKNSDKVLNHTITTQKNNMHTHNGTYIIVILLSCLATLLFFQQRRKNLNTKEDNGMISQPEDYMFQEFFKIDVQPDIPTVNTDKIVNPNKTINLNEIPDLGKLYGEFKNKTKDH